MFGEVLPDFHRDHVDRAIPAVPQASSTPNPAAASRFSIALISTSKVMRMKPSRAFGALFAHLHNINQVQSCRWRRMAEMCISAQMTDWAISYIKHVLVTKDWSANRLAAEAGLSASTISRPLATPDYKGAIARKTIARIYKASGIDPAPFAPSGLQETAAEYFTARPETTADRALAAMLDKGKAPAAPVTNEIRVAVFGPLAQIVATIDIHGIGKLRRKLDALELMMQQD